MQSRDNAFVDDVLGMYNLLALMEYADPERGREMRKKFRPTVIRAVDISRKLFCNANLVLACMLQLGTIPDEDRTLAFEVASLLKVSCWNEAECIQCALAWAEYRIQKGNVSEIELAAAVPLWPTTDSAVAYGMICLSRAN